MLFQKPMLLSKQQVISGTGDMNIQIRNIAFEANMIETKNLKPNQPRLLETDNHVVVPVNKVVKVLITANDVLHAWAVPSFGVKRDAVPGRINETWFKAEKEGVYYGQCSELCGSRHAFMPITVRVVSEKQYNEWLKEANAVAAVVREVKIIKTKVILSSGIYFLTCVLKILFISSNLVIYLPAILMLLILIVGELVLDLNSKSLANSISLNISLMFPATVISLIG